MPRFAIWARSVADLQRSAPGSRNDTIRAQIQVARRKYVAGVLIEWRGEFTSDEANVLHAAAFHTRVYDAAEWDWRLLVERHSLGWVLARDGGELVGFVNVLWDGLVHAWIQDVMVAERVRRTGLGTRMVAAAADGARAAGCETLHVDFDDSLRDFYFGACSFTPTNAGLIDLQP